MPILTAYELAHASGCGVDSEVLLFQDAGESKRSSTTHSYECIARFYFDEIHGWEIVLPRDGLDGIPWRAIESAMKHLRRSNPQGFSTKLLFKNYRYVC